MKIALATVGTIGNVVLHRLGVAPEPLDVKAATPAEVASRLAQTTGAQMRTAASDLGQAVKGEDGVGAAIRLLEAS